MPITYEWVFLPPTIYIRSPFEIALGPYLADLRFPTSVHWSKVYLAMSELSASSQ